MPHPDRLALFLLLAGVPQAAAQLHPGDSVEGEITASAPVVPIQAFSEGAHEASALGLAYSLRIDAPGPITIELRSYCFDAYLVLQSEDGELIAEDDDGLVHTHARITQGLQAGRYTLRACALRSGQGPFTLEVTSGEPEPLQGTARRAAEIADARTAVAARRAHFGPEHQKTAVSLGILARMLKAQGRYAEAEPLSRRALEIQLHQLGTDHPETTIRLNDLAELLEAQGRLAEAEPLYRSSLEIRERLLGTDHPAIAQGLSNLAGLLQTQGRYAEAEPLSRRALDINQKQLGMDHPEVAATLDNLARLLKAQGHLVEAEPLYRRALEINQKQLGREHSNSSSSLNNLALLLEAQGRYAEAEALFQQAHGIWEAQLGPQHPATATGLNNLARLLRTQGRLAEAEPLSRRALEIREKQLGPHHPRTATTLNNLAALLDTQGRYAEAEPLYRRALEIYEEQLGTEHPTTAVGLDNLAGLLKAQGRLDEAESLYRRALTINEAQFGPEHLNTATDLNNLALLLYAQGRYFEAEPLSLRALEIREERLGSDHPDTAVSLNNLALLLDAGGRDAEAEALYRRALEIWKEQLGPDHPDTAAGLNNLAALFQAQGLSSSAFAMYQEVCDRGLDWVCRELVRSPGGRRFGVAGTQKQHLDRLLSALADQQDPATHIDAVYRRVCAWKGVVFRHVARLGRALSARGAEPEIADLRRGLMDLDGQLSKLAYAEKIHDLEQHAARITTLRDERRKLEAGLFELLGLEPERESTNGEELAVLLPQGAAVLDFLVARPYRIERIEDHGVVDPGAWEAPHVYCFVTPFDGGVQLVDFGEAAPIQAAMESFLENASKGAGLRGRPAAVVVEEDHDERLRALLFDPLAPTIQGVTQLVVIPDGFLGELPFGALPIGAGRFLLEQADVAYATDPVTLRNLLESEPDPWVAAASILASGGVDYDLRGSLSGALLSKDETGADNTVLTAATRSGVHAFSRQNDSLPGTREELADLATRARRIFGEGVDMLVLSGGGATEEVVKAQAADRSLLHLATHGFFERTGLRSLWEAALERAREENDALGIGMPGRDSSNRSLGSHAWQPPLDGVEPGLLAGLVFAGANLPPEDGRDDGILTASEVAHLDLSACHLAVLSACQSGLGSGRSGEGLQSLRRAFHEAGARTVVATLWKVDDEQTRRLMAHFYDGLWKQRLGPGAALREARLELLHDPRTRAPRFWAAFTLSGEWR